MKKIGLLADSPRLSKEYYELVEWLNSNSDLELTALVIVQLPQKSRLQRLRHEMARGGIFNVLNKIAFEIIVGFERLIIRRLQKELESSYDITGRARYEIKLEPKISKSGYVYRFDESDIEKLRKLDLDLLVRCGSGILRGAILNAARSGILSFHHADNRVNRGGPPGFWEVFEKRSSTGFMVQRLTDELDGGDVLLRGSILTEATYILNYLAVKERAGSYMRAAIIGLFANTLHPETSTVYDRILYRNPFLFQSLKYAFYLIGYASKRSVQKLFAVREIWSVGYCQSDWHKAVLWRARTLRNPPGHFLADPFALKDASGRRYIFVEDYNFSWGKGVITAYEVNSDGTNCCVGIALEEDCHLSFPYIFRFNGEIYMCPESSARRDIRIYRCLELPLKWEMVKIAMENVSAVDSMIFEKENKWWLFTTIQSTARGGAGELHIYFAENPLADWHPVRGNPVINDALGGRNGGLLRDCDAVYRVAQVPGFKQYGQSFAINKIEVLSEYEYKESMFQIVEAKFLKYIIGTHHMHHDEDFVVFDFKQRRRS